MKWRGPIGGGAASGKLGAMVASRAKSTQYLRARTTPVNPRTVFQQVVRNAVKALTGLWQTMTQSQRDSWNVYAANVTVTNALGDSARLSGVNWFVGNNTPRIQSGLPAIVDGPTIFDRGNPDWSALAPIFTVGSNTDAGTITLQGTLPVSTSTDSHFLIYVSRPFGPGISFFNGPYQLATSIAANTTVSDHAFTLPFVAGGVGTSDSSNQMQVVIRLDQGDGRMSSRFQGLNQ